MTKRIFTLLMCGVILCSFSALAGDDGTSMEPIHKKTSIYMAKFEKDWNEEIVHIEYDILKTEKSIVRRLSEGYEYDILAYGDNRFKDIDVAVYRKLPNGEWEWVASDTDDDWMAQVKVTPRKAGDYKITITAVEFKGNHKNGHYGLIIAHNKK